MICRFWLSSNDAHISLSVKSGAGASSTSAFDPLRPRQRGEQRHPTAHRGADHDKVAIASAGRSQPAHPTASVRWFRLRTVHHFRHARDNRSGRNYALPPARAGAARSPSRPACRNGNRPSRQCLPGRPRHVVGGRRCCTPSWSRNSGAIILHACVLIGLRRAEKRLSVSPEDRRENQSLASVGGDNSSGHPPPLGGRRGADDDRDRRGADGGWREDAGRERRRSAGGRARSRRAAK